jgi:hypothetical protein
MSLAPQRTLGRATIDVRRHDVLLGRGSGTNEHQGNLMYRSLVKAKKEEYISCTSRQDKDRLVSEVIQEVHDSGGRFLKKLQNGRGTTGRTLLDVYEIANHTTMKEKTRQAFQYFRREQFNSVQVGETAAAISAGTNGSHSREPPHESSSRLIMAQSGMITNQRRNFEINAYRSATSADSTVAPLTMATLEREARALRLRALLNGVLQDPMLTSHSNSASSNSDFARRLLAEAARSDTSVPNLWELSSIPQEEARDSRFRIWYGSVPQELMLTSHHHNYPYPSDDTLRLLYLAGLSDRLDPIPGGGWQQPLHLRNAVTPHDGVLLGSSGANMYRHQLMQLLLLIQEQDAGHS